jgi:hypothetical protein
MTTLRQRLVFRSCVSAALCFVLAGCVLTAGAAATGAQDSDRDGLSDALEQRLLAQFSPNFLVGQADCAGLPAEFRTDVAAPEVRSENGTIYGQVFPAKGGPGALPQVEIHFYHLWNRDCGPHGHSLDTEHVSVLVRASQSDIESATWKALYWYAAAHEDTVCDVSQIARASTLHAEDSGATILISPGKHASYLSEKLCAGGCGADRCEAMVPLKVAAVVNLGEPGRPMNGSDFAASTAWPLTAKMVTGDFPPEALSRLDQTPEDEIVWFHAGRHPAQGAIATSLATGEAIAASESNTVDAVNKAGDSTGKAFSTTTESTGNALQTTGNALQKSYRNTTHALGTTARKVRRALGYKPDEEKPK